MIRQAIKYIADELNFLIGGSPPPVILGNISRLDSGGESTEMQQKIVLTLVNIEEEKTLKNEPAYVKTGDKIEKRNPTLFLNLYILFSSADDKYEMALNRIDSVVEVLQGKHVFTSANSDTGSYPGDVEKIILDIYSLNFEQINHLWGTLGGKYVPSVLYKMRLLPIQNATPEKVGVVEEIGTTENSN